MFERSCFNGVKKNNNKKKSIKAFSNAVICELSSLNACTHQTESHGFHGIVYVSEQDTFFHPGRGTVQDQDLTSVTRPTGHMLVPNSVTFAGTTGQLGTQIFLPCPATTFHQYLQKTCTVLQDISVKGYTHLMSRPVWYTNFSSVWRLKTST